jgi:hypothetical protein
MTDPLTALREVRPPARLDADPVHARIDELIAAPPRRRRLPALALVAVAGAAAAVVLTTGGTPTTTRPAVATAATVLHDLGRRVASTPAVKIGPGQYFAVRVHQYEAADETKGLDTRTWARGDQGRELVLVDGKTKRDVALGTPPPDVPKGAAPPDDLAALPTEPKALAERMRIAATTIQSRPGAEPTARDYILTASMMVFGRRETPPDVLRAVYDFLATLPGIRLIGDVTDPLGRPGKAVAVDGDPDIHEGIGIELILAPDTGTPLAVVHYRDGDVDDPWLYTTRQAGVVTGTDELPR